MKHLILLIAGILFFLSACAIEEAEPLPPPPNIVEVYILSTTSEKGINVAAWEQAGWTVDLDGSRMGSYKYDECPIYPLEDVPGMYYGECHASAAVVYTRDGVRTAYNVKPGQITKQ